MRALILLACCLMGCFAHMPRPCKSPPLLSGSLSVIAPKKEMVFAKYMYDEIQQRIRIKEITYHNKTTSFTDLLFLYRRGKAVVFKINNKNQTCCKKHLSREFHPLRVPRNSSFLGQVVYGSSSNPGEGVLVNNFYGDLQMRKERVDYLCTVTEFGCVPLTSIFHSPTSGWVTTSFFNTVYGIVDPQEFYPPPFCFTAEFEEKDDEEPETFYSVF
ncbi:ependymin-like [Pholidichthys leucotaenia]